MEKIIKHKTQFRKLDTSRFHFFFFFCEGVKKNIIIEGLLPARIGLKQLKVKYGLDKKEKMHRNRKRGFRRF